MSSEPKKSIEELLQASADARVRQFGSDPQMPNPMRARLHDEVARLRRRDEPGTGRTWFTTWWPRLIIGAAAVGVAIGSSLIWWRTQQTGGERLQLATNQPVVATETNRREVQPPRPPAAPETRQNADTGSGEMALAKSAAENAAAAAAPAALAQNGAKNTPIVKQQFSQNLAPQSFRAISKAKQTANVLSSFQIEQHGAEIRVVDADGSTYIGKIEPLPREKDERAATREADKAEPAGNQFYFRAAGYNGSRKKSLIFEGNYAALPSPQEETHGTADEKTQAATPARIVGTAKLNGDLPVPVDAVSVPAGH